MFNLITTKPGEKYASIKNPRIYEALRKKGYSKSRAARISNAMARDKDAGAPLHGPGGLLGALGLGKPRKRKAQITTKPMTRSEAARVAALARWGKYTPRPKPPKKLSGAAVAKPPKPVQAKLPKAPKGGKGKKGGAAAKPKKTEAERQQEQQAKRAEREQERAAEREASRRQVYERMGIAPDGQAALEALRRGEQPDAAAIARGGFVDAGLVEQAADGSYRMTPSGRALTGAAQSGDVGRAGDTISGARDRLSTRRARQVEQAKRRQEAEQRRGSGGGSGKKPPPERTSRPVSDAQRRRRARAQQRIAEAVQRVRERSKAYTPTRTLDSGHTGVMVALYPDQAAVQAIAAAEGVTEPLEQLHLTLCFLGDSTEQPLATNKEKVIESVAEWAQQHGRPLTGEINGTGRFFNTESDGTNAVYVSPDVSGLPELRQSLADWIEKSGFDYAQNHGFTPHITVAYVPEDAPTPPIRVETPVSFDRVTLAWGDEQYEFPLGLRAAAKAETYGGVKRSKLDDNVFAGPDRSFPIKTAQDVRDAVRSLGRTKHDKAAVKRGIIRRARAIGATDALPESWRATQKSFTVYKDSAGQDRWLSHTTTAYRDRDGEILTSAALDRNAQRMTATKQYGPLRYWHIGKPDPENAAAPWGQGLDIGDCDFSMFIGRTLVESGTFRNGQIAMKMAELADDHEMSPGFLHDDSQPDADKAYEDFFIFERSVVPTDYARASNLFTRFSVKEQRMDPKEFEKRLKVAQEKLGLSDAQADAERAALIATDKAAQTRHVAYKSADEGEESDIPVYVAPNGEPGIIWEGHFVELKAFGEMGEDEEKMDGEEMVMEDEEPMPAAPDLQAIATAVAQAVVAELLPHLNISDKIGELKSLMGGYAKTKDDAQAQAEAERQQQVAALQAQIAEQQLSHAQLQAKLKELTEGQPALQTPPTNADGDVVAALKSVGPTPPADPSAPQIPADASPLTQLAARTMPALYTQNPQGQWNGWVPPTPLPQQP